MVYQAGEIVGQEGAVFGTGASLHFTFSPMNTPDREPLRNEKCKFLSRLLQTACLLPCKQGAPLLLAHLQPVALSFGEVIYIAGERYSISISDRFMVSL